MIFANGVYNDALLPPLQGKDRFCGKIVHSSRYTNATDLTLPPRYPNPYPTPTVPEPRYTNATDLGWANGKRVLVVGWGNSGSEIALDLVRDCPR